MWWWCIGGTKLSCETGIAAWPYDTRHSREIAEAEGELWTDSFYCWQFEDELQLDACYEDEGDCTLDNLQNIGDLKPEQLPIDCKGKTLKTSGKVIITDAGGDKVDFTSAKIEAAKGITIKKALGGKFEAASLFTTADVGDVRRAARRIRSATVRTSFMKAVRCAIISQEMKSTVMYTAAMP